jgi:hypothetical protein
VELLQFFKIQASSGHGPLLMPDAARARGHCGVIIAAAEAGEGLELGLDGEKAPLSPASSRGERRRQAREADQA